MEPLLLQLGFNAKEAALYQLLLQNGRQTAAQLSAASGEHRTNIYMIMDSLIEKGVVASDDRAKRREFWTTDPSNLQRLLQAEQRRQQQAAAALTATMPQLRSLHALAHNKPGVVHMAGLTGYRAMLEDMARSNTDIYLIASDLPNDSEVVKALLHGLRLRRDQGIKTHALYHHNGGEARLKHLFAERGLELRFLGDTLFTAEVAVYDNNLMFTVYEPALITTVITDQSIADTMRIVFEMLWASAEV